MSALAPVLLALLPGTACKRSVPPGELRVFQLRAEHMENPLGLDVARPRLSWAIAPGTGPTVQAAYQVLAATRAELLREGAADLWDSGRVPSAEQTLVPYAGKPLVSRQQVHWQVRIWDERDRASPWSEPARFELAFLNEWDWQARWIGPPPDEVTTDRPPALTGAHWIWFDEPLVDGSFPSEHRYLLGRLTLPAGATIRRARALFGVNDNARVHVNGALVQELDARPAPVVDLAIALRPGENWIAVDAENTGRIAGFIARVEVELEGGRTVALDTGSHWTAGKSVDPAGDWRLGKGAAARWRRAQVVAPYGAPRFRHRPHLPAAVEPAPYLRTEFRLDKPVRAARVYLSGLGYHDLHVNGRRVGDHVLDPAFTDYRRRVSYVVHDVTAALRQGDNALGVILGTGFFDVHTVAAWDFYQAPWRARPRLLLQLHVTHDDGTETVIASDERWRRMTGPIRFDGIRNGEHYDARLEVPGWAEPGFAARSAPGQLRPVALVEAPAGKLVAQAHPPIRVIETLPARAVRKVAPGTYVFDLGQTISGWVRLRVPAALGWPAGTALTLRHGERVREDGSLDTTEIARLVFQGDFQTDRYAVRGDGRDEEWEPRFVYHGFRWVELSGVPEGAAEPTLAFLEGRVVHTAFPPGGSFACANPLLERMQEVALWSFRTNFHGIPTDCPHREKNGWTGDAHLALETGLHNFDSLASYLKWTRDILDAQREDGALPGIVPTSGWGYDRRDGPAWDAALFLVPWALYEHTGDRALLAEVYPAWLRYLGWLAAQAKDHLIDFGLSDWLPTGKQTPNTLIATAYYYKMADLAARAATLLGRTADVDRHARLAAEIRRAWRARFFDPETGRVHEDEQAALAGALYLGLVAPDEAPRVLERLRRRIAEAGDHLDTGVHGSRFVLHVLADHEDIDLAHRIVTQESFPGWGDMLARGATTYWESFRGDASLDHAYLSLISHWFYAALAGVRPDPDRPGFAHVVIRPGVPRDLPAVRAVVPSVRGPIESAWQQDARGVAYRIVVPGNARATVLLSAPRVDAVTAGDAPGGGSLAGLAGVELLGQRGPRVALELGAGEHRFFVAR